MDCDSLWEKLPMPGLRYTRGWQHTRATADVRGRPLALHCRNTYIYIYMYTHHCILSFILSFSTLRTTSQQLARHLKQRLKRQPPSGVREELMGQAVQMRLTLYFSIVCVVDEFGLRFGRSLLTRLPISQRYFLRANSKDRVLIVLIRFALLLVEQTLQSSRSTIP